MGDLLLIAVGAALVNNFVLTRFLGLCPVLGTSQRLDGAVGMALATTSSR
jgi:electron transport complex protein RnfA